MLTSVAVSRRLLVTIPQALLSALVGHTFGYLLAHRQAHDHAHALADHSHLVTLARLTAIGLAASSVVAARRLLRSHQLPTLRSRHTALCAVLTLLTLESVEGWLHGEPLHVFTEPGVFLALPVTAVVGWLLARTCRFVAEVAGKILAGRFRIALEAQRSSSSSTDDFVPNSGRLVPVGERAPPTAIAIGC